MINTVAVARSAAVAMVRRTPVLAGIAMRAMPESGWQWYEGADRALTPNRYHAGHRPHLIRPVDAIALHYTASPWSHRHPVGANMARMRRWATGARHHSSTHFVVLRDGRILQMMPLSDRAWHITNSRKSRGRRIKHLHPLDGRTGINQRVIGLDFENVGFLSKDGTNYRNDWGGAHPGPVVEAGSNPRRRYWEAYPEAQIDAAGRLLAALGERFPVLRDGRRGRLFEHSDVQSTRSDPGPACPVDRLYRALMGDEAVV